MLYTYRCKSCGATTDAYRKVEKRHDAPPCAACGGQTHQIITQVNFNAVMGAHDNPGYMCPVTDEWVDSKKKRRRIMDEHDLVEWPSGSGKGCKNERPSA